MGASRDPRKPHGIDIPLDSEGVFENGVRIGMSLVVDALKDHVFRDRLPGYALALAVAEAKAATFSASTIASNIRTALRAGVDMTRHNLISYGGSLIAQPIEETRESDEVANA